MGKILLIISFIFTLSFATLFYLSGLQRVYASTLFKDSTIGSNGSNWKPDNWIQISGQGKYGSDGVMGFTQNFRDFGTKDAIIKFDYNIHAHDTTIIFACRASFDFSNVIQPSLNPDGLTHIDECDNISAGAGSCFRDLPSSNLTDVPYDQSLGTHRIELSCLGNNIIEKEDGNSLIETTSTANLSTGVRFYLTQGSNTISNLEVCDFSGCDEATPTPTPTPTPTSEINLNVPLLKQTDNPWQSQEYDTAHLWSPTNPTIHDWGCALTSAAMTLQFNNIKKMPDNRDLDPGTLNTWLKGQPDGYVGSGLVNWLAISRLSKLAVPNNPEFTYDALEYQRQQGADTATLSADLHNNLADILEEPGHFIVAKGTQGSTFTINDPFYDRNLLTDGYNNSFLSAGKYIPSHTDLSYLLFTGSEDMSFDLKTATESGLGQQFIQNPLTNEVTPSQTSGQPIKLLYLQHPATNTYQLTVSSTISQIYNLKGFAYDKEGSVKVFDVQGIIDNVHPNTFSLDYNNDQLATNVLQKQVTISELLFDLNTLYGKNMIKKGAYITLKNLLSHMQKASDKHRVWEVKLLLNITSLMLNVEKGRGITQEAYSLLNNDIASLKTSL